MKPEAPKYKAGTLTGILNTAHHPILKTHSVSKPGTASIFSLWWVFNMG
jgi:hypothetical protein